MMNFASNDTQMMRSLSTSSSSCSTPQSASSPPPLPPCEREHMFDKVVTPSDVGKLNRLVIPKQHAERYFPLESSAAQEKGLLLTFEDSSGKPWRFRYSYWNSSQSYVITKGWSRFVKDKRLDAGDIVSFHRGVGESGKDRFFIDWRRRPIHNIYPHHLLAPFQIHQLSRRSLPQPPVGPPHHYPRSPYGCDNCASGSWGSGSGGPTYPQFHPTFLTGNPCSTSLIYGFRSDGGDDPPVVPAHHHPHNHNRFGGYETDGGVAVVFESVPVVQGKAVAAKRLRLFGVNMDCPDPDPDPILFIPSSSSNNASDDQDSPLDKAKTSSSSMSLDLEI